MSGDRCGELDRVLARGRLEGEERARWREHLAGCADCRRQESADAQLRGALADPAPELSAGFDAGLRKALERRAAGRPAAAGRPGRLHRSGLWALAIYGTAAAAASVAILTRLPWESLAPSPALGIAIGAIALLSPVALLDRLGIVRPPG